jgi:WD40 repeat protein
VWDAVKRVPVGPPIEQRSNIEEAAFGPDPTIVATRSDDGAARLWDVAKQQVIGPTLHDRGIVAALAFSPDGATFAAASDKIVQLLKLPRPVEGEPGRVALWTQVVTGLEIDKDGAVGVLDAKTWHERSERLEKLGGEPLP